MDEKFIEEWAKHMYIGNAGNLTIYRYRVRCLCDAITNRHMKAIEKLAESRWPWNCAYQGALLDAIRAIKEDISFQWQCPRCGVCHPPTEKHCPCEIGEEK